MVKDWREYLVNIISSDLKTYSQIPMKKNKATTYKKFLMKLEEYMKPVIQKKFINNRLVKLPIKEAIVLAIAFHDSKEYKLKKK